MGVNIVSGNDSASGAFVDGDPRAVDAGVEANFRQRVIPRLKIDVVEAGKTAAFFNVEENYGAFEEAFLLGNFGSGFGLRGAEANGVLSGLDLARFFGIEEQREAKPLGLKERPFAEPGALCFAWWRTQPIAGEGIAFAKDWDGVIAGIVITIKTEKRVSRERSGGKERENQYLAWKAHAKTLPKLKTELLCIHVVGGTVAKGPVFPSNFDKIDDHVFGTQTRRRGEQFDNAFIELTFLLRLATEAQSDLNEDDLVRALDAKILGIINEIGGRVFGDDLKAIVRRNSEGVDHGLVNGVAD
jgi:hypothetical protein